MTINPTTLEPGINGSRQFTGKNGIQITAGELWTSRQRQMHPIHYTISYRASFKPELPEYFIQRYLDDLSREDRRLLDPFGGRGTTVLQANLMGIAAHHNDLNPVAGFIARSRRTIPERHQLLDRLLSLDLSGPETRLDPKDENRLLPFFHPETLKEILGFRSHLLKNLNQDPVMDYLGVTALSRLYGHSDGFFSVYTFPQISIMPVAQERNNRKRNQKPDYKPVKERIAKKFNRDLSVPLPGLFHNASRNNTYSTHDSRDLASVDSESVDLVVTSPPFLDKVDYISDNWMRSWFLDMEEQTGRMELGIFSDIQQWASFMKDTLVELGRVLKPGGRGVIEVGEVRVRGKTVPLEEVLMEPLPLKVDGGTLVAEEIFLNVQEFTKLAHCWDVKNNKSGTNTNRCLVIRKESGIFR